MTISCVKEILSDFDHPHMQEDINPIGDSTDNVCEIRRNERTRESARTQNEVRRASTVEQVLSLLPSIWTELQAKIPDRSLELHVEACTRP